jgi:hypothetical protein
VAEAEVKALTLLLLVGLSALVCCARPLPPVSHDELSWTEGIRLARWSGP